MKFACPHCQASLETDDSFAGAAVDCPMCGQSLVIPAPSPSEEPPISEPPPSEPAPESPVEAPEPAPEAPDTPNAEELPPPPPSPPPKAAPKFRVVSKPETADTEGSGPKKEVECPHCFAVCKVSESTMGIYLDCPSCGKRFRLQTAPSDGASSGRTAEGVKRSMTGLGNIFRNIADRSTEGRKMPLTVPLVFQSIVLALIVLFTLLFCANANAQFYHPSIPRGNANPAASKVYYSIGDMKAIRLCLDNINNAQRKYSALHGGNPADWPHMVSAKYQERHNREKLEKEIRLLAARVAAGTPVGYYQARNLMQYNGVKFIALDADDDKDYESRRDAIIRDIKQSIGMTHADSAGRKSTYGALDALLWLFPIFAILNIVFTTAFHYKCWSTLPAQFARLTPGKAAGRLFIPFYCLYWVFPSIAGLGADCVAFAQDRELRGFNRLRPLGLTLAILMCSGGVVWILASCFVLIVGIAKTGVFLGLWATGGFPVVGFLLATAKFIIWLLFYRGVARLLNGQVTPTATTPLR